MKINPENFELIRMLIKSVFIILIGWLYIDIWAYFLVKPGAILRPSICFPMKRLISIFYYFWLVLHLIGFLWLTYWTWFL